MSTLGRAMLGSSTSCIYCSLKTYLFVEQEKEVSGHEYYLELFRILLLLPEKYI